MHVPGCGRTCEGLPESQLLCGTQAFTLFGGRADSHMHAPWLPSSHRRVAPSGPPEHSRGVPTVSRAMWSTSCQARRHVLSHIYSPVTRADCTRGTPSQMYVAMAAHWWRDGEGGGVYVIASGTPEIRRSVSTCATICMLPAGKWPLLMRCLVCLAALVTLLACPCRCDQITHVHCKLQFVMQMYTWPASCCPLAYGMPCTATAEVAFIIRGSLVCRRRRGRSPVVTGGALCHSHQTASCDRPCCLLQPCHAMSGSMGGLAQSERLRCSLLSPCCHTQHCPGGCTMKAVPWSHHRLQQRAPRTCNLRGGSPSAPTNTSTKRARMCWRMCWS